MPALQHAGAGLLISGGSSGVEGGHTCGPAPASECAHASPEQHPPVQMQCPDVITCHWVVAAAAWWGHCSKQHCRCRSLTAAGEGSEPRRRAFQPVGCPHTHQARQQQSRVLEQQACRETEGPSIWMVHQVHAVWHAVRQVAVPRRHVRPGLGAVTQTADLSAQKYPFHQSNAAHSSTHQDSPDSESAVQQSCTEYQVLVPHVAIGLHVALHSCASAIKSAS